MHRAFIGSLACALLGGCGDPSSDAPGRVEVEPRIETAPGDRLSEQFDEVCFSTDERGRWDVVLFRAREHPDDAWKSMEQCVHLRMFWRPIPGVTHAESSQTDAIIVYMLADAPTAISYEGAGFVFLKLDRSGQTARGTIESSFLAPTRRTGDAADVLGRCRLKGEFTARRDAARVTEILTTLHGRLGPRPVKQYEAPANDPR